MHSHLSLGQKLPSQGRGAPRPGLLRHGGLWTLSLLWACAAGGASEIGYVEDFALAPDRTKALEALITGTEEYYFYHCLHAQNQGDLARVEELLKNWIKRYGRTPQAIEIENRQALLSYTKAPKPALEYLRRTLGLHFNHQQEHLRRKPNLPVRLDPALLDPERLFLQAFQRHANLEGFSDEALGLLAGRPLNEIQRRDLLRRLQRPDLLKLVDLVVEDLKARDSGGFGSHPLHAQMLQAQLDELAVKMPELLRDARYVEACLTKLQPRSGDDWEHTPALQLAYLERLWAFVQKLEPAFNSLKTCVLYRRLDFDRSQGVCDKERFLSYLKLPRPAPYVEPAWLQRQEHRGYEADLSADYQRATLLPPVRDDEALVREYLLRLLPQEEDYKAYATWIRTDYLTRIFAEAKIVNGIGDMERWYSLLNDPLAYQALRDRVDLDFAPENPERFKAADPVSLKLHVKNVQTLFVKIYRLNALNYYRERGQEIPGDLNLDGLVANEELKFSYSEPPLRRVLRTFELPSLKEPGVYVIDFIGNGKSSRALVRKGQLRFLERTGPAGQTFTILDEENRPLKDACLWLEGRRFLPTDEKGRILIPFSSHPGEKPVILQQGELAALSRFQHQAEEYRLEAAFYVDRESLLRHRQAQVFVRPILTLQGTPVPPKNLVEPRLLISTTNLEGIRATLQVPAPELSSDKEFVHEFQVPPQLQSIEFQLSGKVRQVSTGKDLDLAANARFLLNQVDQTALTGSLHLARTAVAGYVVHILGKNGEPLGDHPLNLTLNHRFLSFPLQFSLQSDAQGRVELGALPGIREVKASTERAGNHCWSLQRAAFSYPMHLNAKAGEPLRIPWLDPLDPAQPPGPEKFSLLERRGQTFVQDLSQLLAFKEGFLEIQKLPAGEYDLHLRQEGGATMIRIQVAEGPSDQGYLLTPTRQLQLRYTRPLQIESVVAGDQDIKVQLRHFDEHTRVHLFATQFDPGYDLFARFSAFTRPAPATVLFQPSDSFYQSGRDIGDEYRYILDRRNGPRFPGNMLARPGLLLNPWALADSRSEALEGLGHGSYGQRRGGGRRLMVHRHGGSKASESSPGAQVTLDFLAASARVWSNLKPDATGLVTVPRKALGSRTTLQVLAVDLLGTVFRQLALPEAGLDRQDLRLLAGLDPARHFTEQKGVTLLKAGRPFIVSDVGTAEVELCDSLAKAHRLFLTLSGNNDLRAFDFLLRWPALAEAEKRSKYSEYACHELNFFLFRKDPAFFNAVVKPYLANKRDKTFLDEWLLGAELARYLEPWAFQRLNIFERILLGWRLEAQRGAVPAHVKDLFELLPPNLEQFNQLFKTALQTSALQTGDEYGLREVRKQAELKAQDKGVRGAEEALKREVAQAEPAAPAPPVAEAPSESAAPEGVEGKLERRRKEAPPAAQAAAKEEAGEQAETKGAAQDALEEEELGEKADAPAKDGQAVRRLYLNLEATREWAENNYYHLPIGQQNENLITVHGFWSDFAAHVAAGAGQQEPFLSPRFLEASRNLSEMLLAMALLDLPFEGPQHDSKVEKEQLTLTPKGAAIAFHKELREQQELAGQTPLLVSQNFFNPQDRYRFEEGERLDKYVSEEFLVQTVYGCQVVLTNPTSTPQKLDVLVQIPRGALPVEKGYYTRGHYLHLDAYATQTLVCQFYFPEAGSFSHFPVHVSKNGKAVAAARPVTLKVVAVPTRLDVESWAHLSQHGTPEQVLRFLETRNLLREPLEAIAWRMREKAFFGEVLARLDRRHVFNPTLWSYALFHDDQAAARTFLKHQTDFLRQCGLFLESRLVTLDPVELRLYQHLEYSPLVNERAHRFGRRNQIADARFFRQYGEFLRCLAYRPALDDNDRLAAACYLLLQDRIQEGQEQFGKVKPANLATRLQYEYLQAFLAFYSAEPEGARAIAERHKDHPVERWRNCFVDLLNQLDEGGGKAVQVADAKNREQTQGQLAASERNFDLAVEEKKITLNYQNLEACEVNYYLMDLELLFSNSPFVQHSAGQFAYIRPNKSEALKLPAERKSFSFDLPREFHQANVMIEVTGGGLRKAQAYYAHSLQIQVVENYGQLKLTHQETGKPIPKAYVKAYVKAKNGSVSFFKDGYTDLRGRFDYASVSSRTLDEVERFSLLIMSEENGSVIREAAPPVR